MGARGRKSIETVAALARATIMARPDAPYDLTDEQADEWRAVVNRMPAEWFPRETHAMLTAYCRHVVTARRIAQLIVQTEKNKRLDVQLYNQLLTMQEREGRAISSLATRMRLSQQSTYAPDKAKGKRGCTRPPWEEAS